MSDNPLDEVIEKFPEEVEWRKTLPLEFQPVAQRHGRELFALAYNIGAIREGLQTLGSSTKPNSPAMGLLNAIANGANQLTIMLLEAKQIPWEKVQEIQKDCEIAAQLLGAQRTKPGSSIILPEH